MNYSAALQYLDSFLNFERIPFEYRREFNLKRIDTLLSWFRSPQDLFPSVLIAGTKGKGSTANFLGHIVSANGYRTGLYTSPHLVDPRERIRINGHAISKPDFARIMTRIHSVVRRKEKQIARIEPVTYFEIFTLLAILYFADQKVDLGIFEVGMGGRLDATNILHPLISVITSISYDHQEHLGRTLAAIAGEKAAIIKKNGSVILATQEPEARRVIQREIKAKKAKGYFLGEAFRTRNERVSKTGARFDFQMGSQTWPNLELSLIGRFQIKNAALALEAASILANRYDFQFQESKVRAGLKRAFWPARFEQVRRFGRTYIIDGAHNGASMEELARAVRTVYPGKPVYGLFGTSREKNLADQLKPFLSICQGFILTRSCNPRAQEPRIILDQVYQLKFKHPTLLAGSLNEAIKLVHQAAPKNAIVVIAGSLFLAGEAREILACPKFI